MYFSSFIDFVHAKNVYSESFEELNSIHKKKKKRNQLVQTEERQINECIFLNVMMKIVGAELTLKKMENKMKKLKKK